MQRIKQFICALFMLMLMPLSFAVAADIENQDGSGDEDEQQGGSVKGNVQIDSDDDDDDDDDDDEKKGLIRFLCGHLKADYKTIKKFVNSIFRTLETPRGIAAVACTYGILQGISNFMWAFNWERHTSLSADDSATLQEVGGLSAAAECFLLGAVVPVMLYQWNKRHPNANAANN